MRIPRKSDAMAAILLVLSVAVACGQACRPIAPGARNPRTLCSAHPAVRASAVPAGAIVREIDDPHTGDRWLLVADGRHPGGPGRLLLASAAAVQPEHAGPEPAGPELTAASPVIRTGDRVIVEEKTAVAEARLEAIAISPAAAGSVLTLRLIPGGSVVRAVAVGPGRAMFPRENGR